MIQELLGGGAALVGGERKISISGILEGSPSPSPSRSSSANTTTTAAATTTTTTATSSTSSTSQSTDHQSLRCPRCDSSNTKFCYYNNYNLTQPRHFCKTCRRYWTKGGALRNVPIGGGCRKNKNTTVSSSTSAGKPSSCKVKTASDIVTANLGSGFDHHDPHSNPILWASPQNSQLLALLRASQNANPNPNPMYNNSSVTTVKDEGGSMGSSHMTSDHALNATTLSLDPLTTQIPIGLCSSFWRNNQHHHQPQQHHHQHQQQQHGLLLGDHQVQNSSSGIQELYQRLRSSSANYYSTDHSQTTSLSTNVASSTSILEPAAAHPVGGELGYWTPAFSSSWSDLHTNHGAFP